MLSDGDLSDGHLSDGHLSDGDLSDGDLSDGDLSDGDLSDGDLSDGQVVSVTDCNVKPRVFESNMNADFQCSARSLHRPAFYDAITGPTEFISLVKSLKMANIPRPDNSSLRKEKVSVNLFIINLAVQG